MNLFTVREKQEEAPRGPAAANGLDLRSLFDFVNNFILDFKRTLKTDSINGQASLDNIFQHLYRLTIEAYIQRLVFAIAAPKVKGKLDQMPGGDPAKTDQYPFFFYLISATYRNHFLKPK